MPTNNLLRPKPHLTYDELKTRYQQTPTARQQRYWNLIRLMSHPKQPLTVTEAAHACGFGQRWARQLVHRYNAKGPDKYYDQRRHNPGQDSLLTKRQQAALKRAIMRGHTKDGSLWTNVTVRDWIEEKTGRRPNETTGLNYLRILGFTVLSPRPRHTQAATAAEAAAFKKSSTGVSGS